MWIWNIFSNCYGNSFQELVEVEDDIQKDDILQYIQNKFVLVKFDKELKFLVSEDGEAFSFIPSKSIEEVKLTWFEVDEDKAKNILYNRLSKLSENRKVFHEPDYFVNRIKKVYFRYENKQIVPYRYSIKKTI